MTKKPLESSDCYRSVQIHKGNSSITVITVLVNDGIKDHNLYGKLSETFMKDFMEVEWLTHKALDVGGSVMA